MKNALTGFCTIKPCFCLLDILPSCATDLPQSWCHFRLKVLGAYHLLVDTTYWSLWCSHRFTGTGTTLTGLPGICWYSHRFADTGTTLRGLPGTCWYSHRFAGTGTTLRGLPVTCWCSHRTPRHNGACWELHRYVGNAKHLSAMSGTPGPYTARQEHCQGTQQVVHQVGTPPILPVRHQVCQQPIGTCKTLLSFSFILFKDTALDTALELCFGP